jgi:hypothetical protein
LASKLNFFASFVVGSRIPEGEKSESGMNILDPQHRFRPGISYSEYDLAEKT